MCCIIKSHRTIEKQRWWHWLKWLHQELIQVQQIKADQLPLEVCMVCPQPVWFLIGIFDKRAGVSTCTADKTEDKRLYQLWMVWYKWTNKVVCCPVPCSCNHQHPATLFPVVKLCNDFQRTMKCRTDGTFCKWLSLSSLVTILYICCWDFLKPVLPNAGTSTTLLSMCAFLYRWRRNFGKSHPARSCWVFFCVFVTL